MYPLTPSELQTAIKILPGGRLYDLRAHTGALVMECTKHEIEILAFHDLVEGMATKRGLRYLRLNVSARTASGYLRRTLASYARLVAEDSQLIDQMPTQNGIRYSHADRTNFYGPEYRPASCLAEVF